MIGVFNSDWVTGKGCAGERAMRYFLFLTIGERYFWRVRLRKSGDGILKVSIAVLTENHKLS